MSVPIAAPDMYLEWHAARAPTRRLSAARSDAALHAHRTRCVPPGARRSCADLIGEQVK